MSLFNTILFPDVCHDEIRGRKFRYCFDKKLRHLQLCNTENFGKKDANKSIQYMKLIENQSLFHMVWLIFTLVLYIFIS